MKKLLYLSGIALLLALTACGSSEPAATATPTPAATTPYGSYDNDVVSIATEVSNNTFTFGDSIITNGDFSFAEDLYIETNNWSFFTNITWGVPVNCSAEISSQTLNLDIQGVYWEAHYGPRIQLDGVPFQSYEAGTIVKISFWAKSEKIRPLQIQIGRRVDGSPYWYSYYPEVTNATYEFIAPLFTLSTNWQEYTWIVSLNNNITEANQNDNGLDCVLFEFGGDGAYTNGGKEDYYGNEIFVTNGLNNWGELGMISLSNVYIGVATATN